MENTKENNIETNQPNVLFEKKIIIYLIILSLILIFISLFFIHDIVDKGAAITDLQTSTITYPDDNNPDNIIDYTKDNDNNNENKETVIIDEEARLRILQGTKEWSELKELDIFKHNMLHVVENKRAPGVTGKYVYTVENYGEIPMIYNMSYTDENNNNINMVFKLKLNGKYIAGSEENWVKINELNQENLRIEPSKTDIFTIEWKWEDTDRDTPIGETDGANYKIFIKSTAQAEVK